MSDKEYEENYYQYELNILNLQTNKTFIKYIKNEYFLRKFKNKCRFSKKIRIIGEIKRW